MSLFRKATVASRKFKILLAGPAGAGKTYTSLRMAKALGGPVAVIDSEHGSSEIYADQFDFDVLVLDEYHPKLYIAAIEAAQEEGYGVLVIDGLSHAWFGPGGILSLVDVYAGKYGGNRFAAWADASPLHRELFETILGANIHVIGTVRTKTRYEVDFDPQRGAMPKRIGTAPVQREGVEYEFDVVGYLDPDNHALHIWKSRFSVLADRTFTEPGENVIAILQEWAAKAGGEAEVGPSEEYERLKQQFATGAGTKPRRVETGDVRRYWQLVRERGIPREEAHRVLRERGVTEALRFAEEWNPQEALEEELEHVPN